MCCAAQHVQTGLGVVAQSAYADGVYAGHLISVLERLQCGQELVCHNLALREISLGQAKLHLMTSFSELDAQDPKMRRMPDAH